MTKKYPITLFALGWLAGLGALNAQKVDVARTQDRLQVTVEMPPCTMEAWSERYSVATMEGLPRLMSAGNPALPFYPVQVLVPAESDVAGVTVTSDEQDMTVRCQLTPAAAPLPPGLNGKEGARGNWHVATGTYVNGGYFPEAVHSQWQQKEFAGYRLISLNLYPVRHEGLLGKVRYSHQFHVNVDLRPARGRAEVQTDFEARVQDMVCNPDVALTYRPYGDGACREEFPYIIIAPKKLVGLKTTNNFEALVKYLQTEEKIGARIVTTEEIYQAQSGKDNAEKIRNYIRKAFKENKTRYVLLGGAARKGQELVPIPRFNFDFTYKYANGKTQRFKDAMPCDHYYASLGSDMAAKTFVASEISVGRAPVDNATSVDNFVRKTIQAYKHAKSGTPKALLVGEKLFSNGQFGVKKTIWGAYYMDEVLKGASTHGFKTAGFNTNSQWSVSKLYEKESNYNVAQVKEKLGSGVCWVNQIGHSSPTINMKLSPSSAASLTNKVPFLYFTSGCNAGRFTGDSVVPLHWGSQASGECVAEALINGKCGAYGVVSNWSYGLGPEDPEAYTHLDAPGACQYFQRYFVDAYFTGGFHRSGDMMNYMKDKMISWMGDPKMQTETVRWTYYQLHLLGDPRAPLPK